MATVREGSKGALVVVDVQVGVVDSAWEADRVVGNVARAVERAREAGVPVLWVQHQDEELVRDTPAWQWVPELVPADGETRVFKEYNSSFEKTSLDGELARLGVSHLALAGPPPTGASARRRTPPSSAATTSPSSVTPTPRVATRRPRSWMTSTR